MFTSRTRNIQYFIDYQKSQKSHIMEKKHYQIGQRGGIIQKSSGVKFLEDIFYSFKNFGVKFGIHKFCLCKRNDKYHV